MRNEISLKQKAVLYRGPEIVAELGHLKLKNTRRAPGESGRSRKRDKVHGDQSDYANNMYDRICCRNYSWVPSGRRHWLSSPYPLAKDALGRFSLVRNVMILRKTFSIIITNWINVETLHCGMGGQSAGAANLIISKITFGKWTNHWSATAADSYCRFDFILQNFTPPLKHTLSIPIRSQCFGIV